MPKLLNKKDITHFSSLQLKGRKEGDVSVFQYNAEGEIMIASGTTVPVDGTAGYAKGALFIKTDAAANVVGTYHNVGTNTSSKFEKLVSASQIKMVSITVAAGATSGSSADDSELVGGTILGIYPTGNQDQLVDNVVLNADGSITITLAAAATADNTFNVSVLKA